MKISLLLLLAVVVVGCGVTEKQSILRKNTKHFSIKSHNTIHINIDFQDNVLFRGELVETNAKGKDGNVMYPGDSGAVFLAAIFTHAAISGSAQDEENRKLQEASNKVLTPYSKHLEKFKNIHLINSTIDAINNNYDFNIIRHGIQRLNNADYAIKSKPVFFLSQDQKQLILRHAMTLHRAGSEKAVLHLNMVELISDRYTSNNSSMFDFWIKQNNLAKISSEMYAKSIELFIMDVQLSGSETAPAKQKTFSFAQGGQKTYERGTLLKKECNYTVMRNLRGWIKAFPDNTNKSSGKATTKCKKSYIKHKDIVNLTSS